ncbi:MAG: alpha-1,2-fucosyltransferase [bacterium]
MIITKLIGGLGNQMFQYVAGRRAAIANKTELNFDITGYVHQVGITKREYMLHIFRIDEKFATQKEIVEFKRSILFFERIFSRHSQLYVKEKHFHFDPDILTIPDNTYLEGYWASEKYFKNIEDIIRKEFIFKDKPDTINQKMISRIRHCNSISIHVRRSDYIADPKTHNFHGVCGLGYYKKAVSFITKKAINPFFFVFSDDPYWCQTNLRFPSPTVYVTHNLGNKDYEDMRLMSTCKHNIIANSSFSWWSAWLNNNPNKMVITPKKWFNISSINTSDLIPKQWLKI